MEYVLLFLGGAFLSIIHTLIPNHWVPIITLSRYQEWSNSFTKVSIFIVSTMHALSTIIVGLAIGILGMEIFKNFEGLSKVIPSGIFILMGTIFISLHIFDFSKHHHHHSRTEFHLLHSHKKSVYLLGLSIVSIVILITIILIRGNFSIDVLVLGIFIILSLVSMIVIQKLLERKHKFLFFSYHEHTNDDNSIHLHTHSHTHIHHSISNVSSEHSVSLDRSIGLSKWSSMLGLGLALFFSPCAEIEIYYIQASVLGISGIILLSLTYWTITVILTYILVGLGEKVIQKFKLDKLEHNEDLITGITLILFSVLFYVF